MAVDATGPILLTGFAAADARSTSEALGRLGRAAREGDPVNDPDPSPVLAAAYDESSLRGFRAAALDESRPWAFCVPASERSLVAAAASAREGRLLLLPMEDRELKKALSALAQDAHEMAAGDAAFSGLDALEASFSWKGSELDVSRTCRSLARLLRESGFYPGRSGEDECALALEEALVNSLEHGNLELASSLRPDDMLGEDRFEAERSRRLADPAYGGRKIRIGLSISGDAARLYIEDEGPGFDTSKLDQGPSGLEVSGKGFWLIKRPFDSAAYNQKGNRLTLEKRKARA